MSNCLLAQTLPPEFDLEPDKETIADSAIYLQELEDDLKFRSMQQQTTFEKFSSTTNNYKVHLSIEEDGIYFVSAEDVYDELGETISNTSMMFATNGINLQNNGMNIAYKVHTINTSTGLLFYAEGISSPFADKNIYILEKGEGDLWSTDLSVAPTNSVAGQTFSNSVEFISRQFSRPDLTDLMEYGTAFGNHTYDGLNEAFDLPGISGSNATLSVQMFESMIWPEPMTCNFYVNGEYAYTTNWSVVCEPIDVEFSIDNAVEDNNVLTTPSIYYKNGMAFLKKFEVNYNRFMKAENDFLKISNLSDQDDVSTISGFTSTNLFVLDITDKDQPVILNGLLYEDNTNDYSVSFVSTNSSYVAFSYDSSDIRTDAGVSRELVFEINLLAETNEFDYIMIMPNDGEVTTAFVDALDDLADYRTETGFNVLQLTLQDVYNQFAYGIKDAYAIKTFLNYANTNWTVSPKYVALCGIGTYDYFDTVSGASKPNLIPPLLTFSHIDGMRAADSMYVDFNNDLKPDIPIGRLPFYTSSKMAAYVQKVINYEKKGMWHSDVGFIASRNEGETSGNFPLQSDVIARYVPDDYMTVNILSQTSPVTMTSQTINFLNYGFGLVNYFGHGAYYKFSDSGYNSMLENANITSIYNIIQPSVFFQLTCDTGRFSHYSVTSIAEVLTGSEVGSSALSFACTASSIDKWNYELGHNMFDEQFNKKTPRIGDIVVSALNALTDIEEQSEYIYRTYNIFGDPALMMQYPVILSDIVDGEGTVEPQRLDLNYGDYAVITNTPAENYFIKNIIIDDQLLSPTNYVEFVSVTNSHTVSAIFEGNPTEFFVDSVYGSSNYGLGTNVAPYDSSLTCYITNEVVYSELDGIRYVCIGWEGNGSVPNNGEETSVSFILTNETHITWLWSTQVLFRAVSSENCTIIPEQQWYDIDDTNAVIQALPDEGYHFVCWTGDVPYSVQSDNPVTLTMDEPKSVGAVADLYSITPIAGTNGTIYPESVQKYPTGSTSEVFRIIADYGSHVDDVLIDGESNGSLINFVFENINSNHVIEAIFATNSVDTFSINADHNNLGYIVGDGGAFSVGSTALFSNVSFEHAHVEDVIIDGVSIGATNQYVFENIISNHQYNVTFAMDTNSVYVANGNGYCNLPDGSTFFDYGSVITCGLSVSEFILPENDAIKLVNTGWVDGFGDISDYGDANFVNFTLTEDSGLSWAWNTQYWFNVSVNFEEAGYLSESSDWHNEGAFLLVSAIANEHYEFVQWIGDNIDPDQKTNAVLNFTMPEEPYSLEAIFSLESFPLETSVSDENAGQIYPEFVNAYYGTNVTFSFVPNEHYYVEDVIVDGFPVGSTNEYTFEFVEEEHSVSVVFGTNSYNLILDSPYNVTVPAVGTNSYVYSNLVEVVVTNSIVYDEDIFAKYCATGWIGSGSAPVVGSQTNFSFNIEEESTVNILWQTNYYIELGYIGSGYIDSTSSWHQIDSTVVVNATPTNVNYHFKGWLGDTNGCLIAGEQISVPVDMPRSINAWFKTNVYNITSSSTGPGSIVQEGVLEIPHGQNSPVYYMLPSENAHIENLQIDGQSHTIVDNYQFNYVTNDHFISADFATNSAGYYSLIVNIPSNGAVVADSYYVQSGEDIAITNTPDSHYHVSDILLNGTNVAPADTFVIENIQTNIYLDVSFAIDTNKLDIIDSYGKANYPEGDNWFDYGEDVSVSMTNDAIVFEGMNTQLFCYGWAGTGSVISGTGTNTDFNLQTDSSIQWLWNTQYLFEATSSLYGTVMSTNGWYDAGDLMSAEAIPDYGYHFIEWQGNVPENMKTNEYIYPALNSAISVVATFDINHYPVSVSYGNGGSIVPDGTNYVAHGSNITFNIVPDEHYHIDNVLVDGESVGSVDEWTFTNVTNNHQLYASFEIDKHSLAVESLFGGEVPLGTNMFDYGSLIECSVTNSPIINAETQYVCVGWTAIEGASTTNGVGTNLTFTIVDDTQLTWNWQTNYWVDIELGTGLGTVDMTSGWYKADILLSPTATPTNGYHLSYWSGDTYIFKQFLTMYYDTINITNSYPKRLRANFAPDNVLDSFYIPGATNDISSVPAYLNSTQLYPLLPGKTDDSAGGICWAVGHSDILSYYDRNGYNNIPYWNIIANGEAPLRQDQIYQSPGTNIAFVAGCITNLGNIYYDINYNDSGDYRERETILQYTESKGLEFEAVWHKYAQDDVSRAIYLDVIADEIMAGRPVGLGWYGGAFYSHVVVALGYKKEADIVNSTVYIAYNQLEPDRRAYVNLSNSQLLSMITMIPGGTPKDMYEEYGDSFMTNTAVTIHPDDIYDFRQTHCFDTTNDVDWLKCPLTYGREYKFETLHLGPEVGTVLELYTESGELIESSPASLATNGSTSYISYVAISNQNVYLKLSPAEADMFGYNSNYDIQVTFSNMFATLEVYSQYGMTSMTNGLYEYPVGTYINCSITNQTSYNSNTNATKYTFKSWQLKDVDDSTSGTSASCALNITKDSKLNWSWQTNHWVDIQPAEHGSFDTIDSWIKHNSYIDVIANADQYYHFTNWVGDVSALTTDDNIIYGSVTSPLVISAVFKPNVESGGTPDWWLASYGLTNDFAFQETYDFDDDGLTSGEEYITGTDPTDIDSLFILTSLNVGTNELNPYSILNWTYTNNRLYAVERKTNLLYDAVELTNNLPIGIYTDYYDSVEECLYYKINVRLDE